MVQHGNLACISQVNNASIITRPTNIIGYDDNTLKRGVEFCTPSKNGRNLNDKQFISMISKFVMYYQV